MISDTLHAAIGEIDYYLSDPTHAATYAADLVTLAQIHATRSAMCALAARLDAPPPPPVCVPGCVRGAREGPGHPGACVEPPGPR